MIYALTIYKLMFFFTSGAIATTGYRERLKPIYIYMIYIVLELKETFWGVLIIQLIIHSLAYIITMLRLLFNVKVQTFIYIF